MFRLRQKHAPRKPQQLVKPDARRILAEQSMLRALAGGLAVSVLLCWAWALLSVSTGRVYPWLSILLGALIGLAVQRFGRGLDWRFPLLAAVLACITAYLGNLTIGVVETGRYIEASPLRVFAGLSPDTMHNFFGTTIGPVDHIYAFCAAGVAAFLANRRLNRQEVLAVRTNADKAKRL